MIESPPAVAWGRGWGDFTRKFWELRGRPAGCTQQSRAFLHPARRHESTRHRDSIPPTVSEELFPNTARLHVCIFLTKVYSSLLKQGPSIFVQPAIKLMRTASSIVKPSTQTSDHSHITKDAQFLTPADPAVVQQDGRGDAGSIPSLAQQVNDPALLRLWRRSQLQPGFNQWPGNFTCLEAAKKSREKKSIPQLPLSHAPTPPPPS